MEVSWGKKKKKKKKKKGEEEEEETNRKRCWRTSANAPSKGKEAGEETRAMKEKIESRANELEREKQIKTKAFEDAEKGDWRR